MDRHDIYSALKSLARSQGFYGRLLTAIDGMDDETRESLWSTLEDQHFDDVVDLVMFLEG